MKWTRTKEAGDGRGKYENWTCGAIEITTGLGDDFTLLHRGRFIEGGVADSLVEAQQMAEAFRELENENE